MIKILLYSFIIPVGALILYLVNIFLIERLIIPDLCYYHSHDTNFFIDLFYNFPSSENGHPVASSLNIVLTAIMGGGGGYYFVKRKMK